MLTAQFLSLVPVVVGLVQALKKSGLGSRYVPVTAIFLGILSTWIVNDFEMVNTLQGIIVGLSAIGLWSGSKNSFN